MATVRFTPNLERHVACPPGEARGATVREVLESVFGARPGVREYVLDEHGAVRHHMAIFVDGVLLRDRASLSDPVREHSEIYVMQALSGG